EGVPSIAWAFFWLLIARDRPHEASWLSSDCCDELNRELDLEQRTLPSTANFLASLRMPGVLLLCVQYFCWSVGVYGFVLWLPTMIRSGMARGIEIVGL